MITPTVKLLLGDCLVEMEKIPDNSIDAVITDPPYGTTACAWDSVIPFEPMWKQLKRIIKDNGAIVLFGSQPFTSALVMSNVEMFKYEWVWDKKIPSGMSFAKHQPMRQTEYISIFYRESPTYNPQLRRRHSFIQAGGMVPSDSAMTRGYKPLKKIYDSKNPTTLLTFDKVRNGSVHPTQKPVTLMEYLVKTYTNEGETVLDFTMGSGTTGVACKNLNRNFIGIELDPNYFEIAKRRINDQSVKLYHGKSVQRRKIRV